MPTSDTSSDVEPKQSQLLLLQNTQQARASEAEEKGELGQREREEDKKKEEKDGEGMLLDNFARIDRTSLIFKLEESELFLGSSEIFNENKISRFVTSRGRPDPYDPRNAPFHGCSAALRVLPAKMMIRYRLILIFFNPTLSLRYYFLSGP